MLRVLLSARWVGFTLLLVLAVAACARLGAWQWDRAHPDATFDPAREAASALRDVLDRPDGGADVPAGALVRASGRYDAQPERTEAVPRESDGVPGVWVLTPLLLDGDREVLVLRGWVSRADVRERGTAALAPTDADVVVTGRLQPAASEPGVEPMFVALTDQQPAGDDGLSPVPFPPAPADAELRLVNALYAFQWWIFAAFWVYLWWRTLRDDLDDARSSPDVHEKATV